MSTHRTADQPLRGIAYILISMTAFSVMNVFAKNMTGHFPVLQVVFFRSLFVLVPCTAVILWRRRPHLMTTPNLRSHIIRGIVGLATMLCIFYAIALLPLADAVAIGFLGPSFAKLAAMLLLKEKATRGRWIALFAGLAGVLLMLQPSGGEAAAVNRLGVWIALAGAVLYGITTVWLRKLGRTEPALTTVWIFAVFSTIVMALALPFVWVTPGWGDTVQLVLTGISAFLGQLYVTKAYQYAPAATVSPFNYTTLIWALLFGYVFWQETPTPQILAGALLVVVVGIATALHEARSTRRQRPAPLL